MIFETHAHVHDRAFDADRADALARARAAGVGRIITVGCDLHDSARACAVAEEFGLLWSIGVHPHEAKDAPDDVAAAFDAAIAAAPHAPIAIGETGLDYYYDHSPRDVQQRVMRAQIRYAASHRLPVIFHQRDAFADFIAVLRDEWHDGMRGVVHCFTGDVSEARAVTALGLYLGIGGIVTFRNAGALRDAVLATGLERLVLETDCPYLAPAPHRGRRNEPAFIANTAEALARLVDATPSDVAEITARNAEAIFTPA